MKCIFSDDKVVFRVSKHRTKLKLGTINGYMRYPISGQCGKTISAVVIMVNQTSNLGQAKIRKGGINRCFIGIFLEAYKTLSLNYTATVYGK